MTCELSWPFSYHFVDDIGNPEEIIAEFFNKFRRGDMNLDDKLDETEFLYFQHPEHNPQSIKDLVEDMISSFDKNQDKVINYRGYRYAQVVQLVFLFSCL